MSNDWIRPPKFGIIVEDVSKPKPFAFNMITPIMKLRTCVLSMNFVNLIIVQLLFLFDVICDVQLIRLDRITGGRFTEMFAFDFVVTI